MSAEIDLIAVYARIRAECRSHGAGQWARKIGVSPQFLSQVVNGHKPPSDAILSAVGVKRLVKFVEASVDDRT